MKQGIETLTKHAFNNPSSTTSRNALRVLCNAMLLKPETRQMFIDLGYEAQACEQLKNDNRDDEFLISRLIFLTTYGTTIDLKKLIKENHLADAIVENLSRHAKRRSTHAPKSTSPDPMDDMSLVETLKLLVNVSRFDDKFHDSFAPAAPHLATLFRNLELPSSGPPLAPPIGPLINALMTLLSDTPDAHVYLFPKEDTLDITNKLIRLLDLSLKAYPEDELEQTVSPLACVFWSMYGRAPSNAQQLIREKLLPSDKDRQTALGKTDTLPSRLLRNSTNPLAPEFRKAISNLFFEMSDKDASKFVKNVGYGYSSGFLFQNKQSVPDSARETHSESGGAGRPINPITGQFLDLEAVSELPEMTDEEKEREAERLFVLFER